MNSEIERLFQKRRGKIRPGIDLMHKAVSDLDLNWQKPHILVAGTNGKGTTSGYITALLSSFGQRVGLYSSPHIFTMRERFFGPEGMAKEAEVTGALTEIKSKVKDYESLSFFDVSTLIAFLLFRNWNVDSYVLEVGLGGRLDSTNCCDPSVSVVTSIGLDHQEYLGPDIASIASEKAGVIRPDRPIVIGSGNSIPADAIAVIQEKSKALGAHLVQINEQGEESGSFLDHNWRLARKTVEAFLNRPLVESDEKLISIRQSAESRIPTFIGRMQVFDGIESGFGKSQLTVDVGHNMQCVERLVEQLEMKTNGLLLFTCMKDKPWKSMLNCLLQIGWKTLVFASKQERSINCEEIKAEYPNLPCFESFEKAWESSQGQFSNIVLTGSVMGLSDALLHLNSIYPQVVHLTGESL